ncbi:MAG: kelch repeat-containing protein [Planctomycetota bacterium]
MARTSLASLALAGVLTGPVTAQHFAKPEPINPQTVNQIGAPAFTIAHPTTSFGSVVDNGWLYVMGGYAGRPHDYYHEAQSKRFYRVNLHNPNHVESLPDTQGLQSCPLEAWDGKIIRTGGLVALNARGEDQRLRSLTTVAAFDPASRSWDDLPPLPSGRSSHDTAIVGSTLYVVGGWTMTDDGRKWCSTMLALDLESPDAGWLEIDAPFKRRAIASVAHGDSVIVIGGLTPEGKTSKDVHAFDTTTGSWSSLPEYPGIAFGIAADVSGDTLVASGADGAVYTLHNKTELEWDRRATLTFPRFFHQVAAVPGSDDLLFFGGISRGVRPKHVERVSLEPNENTDPIVAHWVVPSPSDAKNRQGIFVEDGWIYAFGGNNSTGQHDFEQHNFLSEGYRLSLAGLTWREAAELPVPRQSIQTATYPDGSNTLFVGGFAHDGEVARTFSQGFAYNHRGREWTELGSVMPTPRSQFGLVEHNGAFWVFGGLDYDSRRERGDHFRHITALLTTDASSESLEFEETPLDLPRPRRAFGGAALDGKYYLVGGMRENFTIVPECDVFDFETNSFSQIASPSRPRLSPSLVELGGRLYLAGGSSPKLDGDGLEPNRSIEVYDPPTDTWSTLMDEIPVSPRHMRMMAFRGRLMLVTSHFDDADMTHVVLIDTEAVTEDDAAIARR